MMSIFSQRAQLGAALTVLIQMRAQVECLLLDLQAVVEADQVPVEIHHVLDGGDGLLLEGEIADVPLVLGDADGAVVDREPENR